MLEHNVGIYALVDPRNKRIRYVGSSIHIDKRYKEHLNGSLTLSLGRWLSELKSLNLKPELLILELCQPRDLTERETFHMEFHKGDLLNKRAADCTKRYLEPPPPRRTLAQIIADDPAGVERVYQEMRSRYRGASDNA